ncbi:SPOR domain-containing protein [Sphingomonas sp.]|uniref:SPOR domain-containing protein n=1 Tax=Sphingomonas sp. TaxID=28214 RepID=UPI003CC58A54
MPARRLLIAALLLAPVPALAQASFQPAPQADADALAEQMRRLGANPTDLDALLDAGEISIRLEDYSAAGAFFQRAERVDPRNGRVKAGEAAMLVHAERPAESLRFFAAAEQLGVAPARFAAERGLAYDLLGDPGRAQRDYRQALAGHDDPEARRRYALSLGIAGRQAQALDELAPLIRQNDRAAWRTRAFVLAMGGDSAGALRIAETMMPPGAAQSLQQFFVELPRLPAIDRAFAVHFGEVRATPQRLADARLAPHQAPLPLDPAPVQVAAVQPVQPVQPPQSGRRDRRNRNRRNEPVAVAIMAPAPPPLPPPPAYQAPVYTTPAATTPMRDRPLTAGEQATLAMAGIGTPSRHRSRSQSLPPQQSAVTPVAARALTPAEQRSLAAAGGDGDGGTDRAARRPLLAVRTPPEPVRSARVTGVFAPSASPGTVASAPATPDRIVPAAPVHSQPPVVVARVLPAAEQPGVFATIARPPQAPASAPVTVAIARPVTPPPVTLSPIVPVPGDAPALASVTDAPPSSPGLAATTQTPMPTPGFATTLTAPVSVEPLPVATETIVPAAVEAAPEPLARTPAVAATTSAAPPPSPRVAVVTPRPPHRNGRGEADGVLSRIVAGLTIPASELDVAPADRRIAERRAAADRKAQADRRAAAAAQAEADRQAAEDRRIARAEPPRIWVQVAGGANEAGLTLAWRTMRDRAPDVLGSRQAWTTPLRATNRVLTGPFHTDAEARAVVNQLGHAGVQAFTFTSEAGQKVTRLATH